MSIVMIQEANAAVTTPASGKAAVFVDSNSVINIKNSAGTVTTVASLGGSNTQVTFNDNGALGGSAAFTFNKSSNVVTISGNANVGNIGGTNGIFTTVQGTLSTAAQPNITSVGTLSSLGVSGNITVPNVIANTGFLFNSVNAAVSASGTVQGNATSLTREINVTSTVATGAGVALPTAVAGMHVIIINTSANAVLVYPASGGTINSLALNAAYSLSAGGRLEFVATSATQWYTLNATYA